jgi:molecular chaperone IbpA
MKMRSIDLTPLYRASVGFDQFADLLDRVFSQDMGQSGYPPFNIAGFDNMKWLSGKRVEHWKSGS